MSEPTREQVFRLHLHTEKICSQCGWFRCAVLEDEEVISIENVAESWLRLEEENRRLREAVGEVYRVLAMDFGGWWQSAPPDEPLGIVKRTLRAALGGTDG